MKRSHACAFQLDGLERLPNDCQILVFSFLRLKDVAVVATLSKRLKALAYELPHWKTFDMFGLQNQSAIFFSRAHGRKVESLSVIGMRISRALCNGFSTYNRLEHLDITNIWKSPSVNDRFVNILIHLPLKSLQFGPNEITGKGFLALCKGLGTTLETFDFNSRFIRTKGFYGIVHLQKLKSLTLRSCINLDHTVVPFICALRNLCVLQLSFLPLVSATCLNVINKSPLKDQLVTLVLNGMYLNEEHCTSLSKFKSLQFLSLCHPQITNQALSCFKSDTLSVFTLFCSKALGKIDFVNGLSNLTSLCFYRCAVNTNSLIHWAERRKKLHIDICKISIFENRQILPLGTPAEKQLRDLPNVSFIKLIPRPFRIIET